MGTPMSGWERCGTCGGTGLVRKPEFHAVRYRIGPGEPQCKPVIISMSEVVGQPGEPTIRIPCGYHGGYHTYIRDDDD